MWPRSRVRRGGGVQTLPSRAWKSRTPSGARVNTPRLIFQDLVTMKPNKAKKGEHLANFVNRNINVLRDVCNSDWNQSEMPYAGLDVLYLTIK